MTSTRHSESNRRQFLKVGAGAAGLALVTNPIAQVFGSALSKACGVTPPQTSGPFYPGESQFGQDSDLTRIPGRPHTAIGQVIYIQGRVVDKNCRPVKGANVEIWQACASGRYNNPKDSNPAPLDPNFKYWAETFTQDSGEYLFKSVIPGAYPANREWTRPPHIHFRVSCLGYHELVTQMYFKGESLNDRDLILRQIRSPERENVIVDFQASGLEFDLGSLAGRFDITLTSV